MFKGACYLDNYAARNDYCISIGKTQCSRDFCNSRNNRFDRKTKITLGDRFIPLRSGIDFDQSNHKVLKCREVGKNTRTGGGNTKFQKALAMTLLGSTDYKNERVLQFHRKRMIPNLPKGAYDSMTFFQYRRNPISSTKSARHIPSSPTRILDAPDLRDDYYLNLLSWSRSNILAVALGQVVYLWNADTGMIEELNPCTSSDDYVTSVSWMEEGSNYLAVGTDHAEVQLWDTVSIKKVRTMSGHDGRVGALAWNWNMLSSGSRDSLIIHHDTRSHRNQLTTLTGHHQEVCGLSWSPDGSTLASGGNDNLLCLWDSSSMSNFSTRSATNGVISPRNTLTQHQAAVKAIAWCPWERNLLASGGGTADRSIKFWNSSNGTLLNSIDTGSQVCGLIWSRTEKEILSSHGFSQNELCLWKYPSMMKLKELTGHSARVLHMAMCPDGSSVVSAAADETLRFWNIFEASSIQKKTSWNANGLSSVMGLR